MNLTPWFDGKVKPARPGVYERKSPYGRRFSHWNGAFWCAFGSNEKRAAGFANIESFCQDRQWRGIFKAD